MAETNQTRQGEIARYSYARGEIRDAAGKQLLMLVASGATKAFRDRCGKTLVGILNAEERGKALRALPSQDGGARR